MALREILAPGHFWEMIPAFEAISALKATRFGELPVYYVSFLNFIFILLLYSYFF